MSLFSYFYLSSSDRIVASCFVLIFFLNVGGCSLSQSQELQSKNTDVLLAESKLLDRLADEASEFEARGGDTYELWGQLGAHDSLSPIHFASINHLLSSYCGDPWNFEGRSYADLLVDMLLYRNQTSPSSVYGAPESGDPRVPALWWGAFHKQYGDVNWHGMMAAMLARSVAQAVREPEKCNANHGPQCVRLMLGFGALLGVADKTRAQLQAWGLNAALEKVLSVPFTWQSPKTTDGEPPLSLAQMFEEIYLSLMGSDAPREVDDTFAFFVFDDEGKVRDVLDDAIGRARDAAPADTQELVQIGKSLENYMADLALNATW